MGKRHIQRKKSCRPRNTESTNTGVRSLGPQPVQLFASKNSKFAQLKDDFAQSTGQDRSKVKDQDRNPIPPENVKQLKAGRPPLAVPPIQRMTLYAHGFVLGRDLFGNKNRRQLGEVVRDYDYDPNYKGKKGEKEED